MDNKDKNDEGTSVDQPESEARAVEDDFEILDIREANELEKPGETNTRDIAGETVKEEITEEPDKQDAHVAGETALNEVAGETVQQKVVMETDKQEVTDEKDKQEVAGETGKGEIAGEAKRQKPDEATGGQDMDMDDEMVIDRKEDARDHGAESKERVWQDNWEKDEVNHVDFFQSDRPLKPCKLEFLGDSALKIDNEEIPLSNLRYATRRQYKSFPQKAAHCIIVSYIAATGQGAGMVKHSFLEMVDVNDTLNLEQDFNKLLSSKYLNVTDADETSKDCLETVYEQPLYFGGADVVVKDAKDKSNSVYDGRCLVVLDIECLTIYPVINDEMGEPHRLMFWKDEGKNSVEKILHYSIKKKIAFETPSMVYELPVIGDVIEQLHELDPKVKGFLHDKALLHQWVTTKRRSKKTPASASASLYPEIHQAYKAELRNRPAKEWENLPGASGTEQWESYRRQDVEKTIVQQLNTELNNAEESFATNEDMQMYWITVEEDLRIIIDSGCVSETDHYSGGLDPDSADHLKRALNDVADQLSEQQLELAVSRIQAARLVFTASQNPEILNFLQTDDMELLRKLYFRSLVK